MLLKSRTSEETKRLPTLLKCFSDPQWTERIMDDALSSLSTRQSQARLLEDRISAFTLAIDKQQKRLTDIKQYGMRHFWYKICGHLESRLKKGEMIRLQNVEKTKEAKEYLIVVNNEIRLAEKQLQILQNAYEQYAKTKQILEQKLS
ncbi:hypothetical protein I4U23_019889 [Adineta vaga]|nr:hypothetical protein I4U23_019889 [Adineta vaga]